MKNENISLLTLITKTIIVHTVTYVIAGILAMTLFSYGEAMGTGDSIFRPISDPIVMAGPLFQPIRGLIFALAFYPIRQIVFYNHLGWLTLWWLLVALGILSTFSPAPGSIEAIIYTNMGISVSTYLEVVMQALAFAVILFFWVNNGNWRWLNWLMGIAFLLVILLPALGLLAGQQN